MTHTNWREIAEVVGIVSIVASLILVALELRQSNRIAKAEVELSLAAQQGSIDSLRFADPNVAQLFAKIEAPQAHLITATDQSRMRALVSDQVNVYRSAQLAFDNELLDQSSLTRYSGDLEATLKRWPALQQYFVELYQSSPDLHGASVFEPVAALARDAEDISQ